MSFDFCVPPPSNSIASAPIRPLHRLSHHIGSRHFHRLRHLSTATKTAGEPSYGCGKHFAEGQSGSLAAGPTESGPALATAKGKVLAAKLAAGGVASLLGAAAVAGVLAMPASFGAAPFHGHASPGGAQGLATSPAALVAPVSSGPPSVGAAAVAVPGGEVAKPVPEPSSLALFGGFASLTLAGSVLLRLGRKQESPSFLKKRNKKLLS